MDILENLYYGNLFPHEKCAKLDDEMKELNGLLNRNEENSQQLFPMSRKKPLKIQGLQSGNF